MKNENTFGNCISVSDFIIFSLSNINIIIVKITFITCKLKCFNEDITEQSNKILMLRDNNKCENQLVLFDE